MSAPITGPRMGAGEADLACMADAEARGPHSPYRGLEPGCARGQPHPLLKCCGCRHFCPYGASVTLALSSLLLGSRGVWALGMVRGWPGSRPFCTAGIFIEGACLLPQLVPAVPAGPGVAQVWWTMALTSTGSFLLELFFPLGPGVL